MKTFMPIYQNKSYFTKLRIKVNVQKRVICRSVIFLYSVNVKLIRSIMCLEWLKVGEGMEQKEAWEVVLKKWIKTIELMCFVSFKLCFDSYEILEAIHSMQ